MFRHNLGRKKNSCTEFKELKDTFSRLLPLGLGITYLEKLSLFLFSQQSTGSVAAATADIAFRLLRRRRRAMTSVISNGAVRQQQQPPFPFLRLAVRRVGYAHSHLRLFFVRRRESVAAKRGIDPAHVSAGRSHEIGPPIPFASSRLVAGRVSAAHRGRCGTTWP